MKIFIGGAWVYANGSLHIGHIASLLSGDVIARYHRLIGNEVCYVSGSDCHGTPITFRAKKDNSSPYEVSEKYNNEFIDGFKYLGFSYDYYGKTTSDDHKEFVKKFHKNLYKSEYIYEKEEPQAFCTSCNKYLADRLVVGKCPKCGKKSRGDQCDYCSNVIESHELVDAKCSECGEHAKFIKTKHLYLAISKLEQELKNLVDSNTGWRKNAIAFTNKYIKEGLRDRAITRDLDWGIEVPKDGYEEKKIYIWAENVLGYLSTCYKHCKENGLSFEEYWNGNAQHYYVHGKDNIPFHTIILPALLLANDKKYHLPDKIISSEHLTLEGKKISTSENWAIWVKDLIGRYDSDSLRYFLIASGPEKRDADFSWREYLYNNNSELLGAYGNFVNRNLVFIQKRFDSKIPLGAINTEIQRKIVGLYNDVGKLIQSGKLKAGIDTIFEYVRSANKYFDEQRPWITINEDNDRCKDTLFNCVYIIANLAILLEPFLPFSSDKLISWFKLERVWKEQSIEAGFIIPDIEILFPRLDKEIVDIEIEKLKVN